MINNGYILRTVKSGKRSKCRTAMPRVWQRYERLLAPAIAIKKAARYAGQKRSHL